VLDDEAGARLLGHFELVVLAMVGGQLAEEGQIGSLREATLLVQQRDDAGRP
jgi:hypothetical protein